LDNDPLREHKLYENDIFILIKDYLK